MQEDMNGAEVMMTKPVKKILFLYKVRQQQQEENASRTKRRASEALLLLSCFLTLLVMQCTTSEPA